MKAIKSAFITEVMKLKRSKILWLTIALFVFIPLMMGLLMLLSQHPELAQKMGVVGTKADVFSENTWSGFFDLISQLIAVIGIIGFGFVTSWIFGRENVERTVIDFLALPTSRSAIIVSKFLVVFLWSLLLAVILFLTSVLIGNIIHIEGWSSDIFVEFVKKYSLISILTILLSTPTAFVASYGRGIIAPLGFVIVSVIIAQFAAVIGWGAYFPWSIPGYATVPDVILTFVSYVILIITSLIGFGATIQWWKRADQH